MGQARENLKCSRLYVNVKPGDCIQVGSTVLHIVGFTSSNRLRIRIEAPSTTPVNYSQSFVREVATNG